ncbi:MAG TPA: glycoside hydrolase family 32 protein [Candidatus Acidoferrum sp.]
MNHRSAHREPLPDASRRRFLQCLGASGALAASPGSLLALGTSVPDELVSQERLAADPLRPQFHLLPARNWMNDPNGPLFWKGQYHMFFQYNPHAAVWGDMHWAHAVSPDMLHWRHLPVALTPTTGGDDADGCFSGSAVVHEGAPTLVYTGVKSVAPAEATLRDGTHSFREVQCLATPGDVQLRTWQKLPAPVLLPPRDPQLAGFRDPCLWRDGEFWYMGVGSGQYGVGGRILLYRSTNLHSWEYLHPLASGKRNDKQASDPVDAGEMWECPDFFALGKKHVLLYSTERKVFWEVGEYDRKELRFYGEQSGLLDHGAYYAPKSQVDARGRRILWGWIPETRAEADFNASGWAGCMSLPRELTLTGTGGLGMRVIPEAAGLRDQQFTTPGRVVPIADRVKALQRIQLRETAAELSFSFEPKPLRVELTDGPTPLVSFSYDPSRTGRELQVNSETVHLPARGAGDHRFQLFFDASIVECFADDSLALTARVYRVPNGGLRVAVPDEHINALTSFSVWPLRPVSSDRLTT